MKSHKHMQAYGATIKFQRGQTEGGWWWLCIRSGKHWARNHSARLAVARKTAIAFALTGEFLL